MNARLVRLHPFAPQVAEEVLLRFSQAPLATVTCGGLLWSRYRKRREVC
jgi:hypothetical protein